MYACSPKACSTFLGFIMFGCMLFLFRTQTSYMLLLSWHSADDYRLFCGDLGNEVNDDVLSKAFSRFSSFNMAKVSDLFPQFFSQLCS